ncbi:hypothetical protein [Rhodococcus jostii]|uniref:hypothetical protein n=1 Tax=Rhodococcus jostii TaxID=132919 RepID=UPI003638F817
MQRVGGSGFVARDAAAQDGAEGMGKNGERDVEIDVDGDGPGERVQADGADRFGETLFDVHPAGVRVDDQFRGIECWLVIRMMGLVMAQAGDGELTRPAGIGR